MKKFKTLSAAFVCLTLFSSYAKAADISVEFDPRLPLVYVNVAFKGGAATDPDGESGLTNFMGEMLLRGTTARTKEQIDLEFDQMGAHLSVDTFNESLVFRGSFLTTQFDRYMKLLGEVLTQPKFSEAEIRKLKSEMISGILQELNDDSALNARKFSQFLFGKHPYGHSILGKTKDIENLTRAKIQAQFDKLIREKHVLILATGDIPGGEKSEKLNAWAKSFSKARSGGSEIKKASKPENGTTRRLLIVDKPDRTQTQIDGGQIGIRMTDKNYFPLYLVNQSFGGGSFLARMMVELRVKRGWTYGANSYFRQGLQPRSWQFHFFPANKDAAPALALELKMIQDLKEHGITQAEFDTTQQSLVNSSGFMYNTPKKRIENILLEKTLDLPEGFMKSYASELGKLSLNQVNSAAKEFFKPNVLAISVLGSAKDIKVPLAEAAGVPLEQVLVVPYTQE